MLGTFGIKVIWGKQVFNGLINIIFDNMTKSIIRVGFIVSAAILLNYSEGHGYATTVLGIVLGAIYVLLTDLSDKK